MTILSWYVAKIHLRYLSLCVLAMLALLIVANMFGNIESVFSGWRNFVDFLTETVRSFPTMLEIVLPMAVLLATVMTFSALSRSSELVAMKTSGMGTWRLIVPIFVMLIPVSTLSYFNQNYLFNVLNPEGRADSETKGKHFWLSEGNKIYYFRHIDPKRKQVRIAVIFDWRSAPFRALRIEVIRQGKRSGDFWKFRNVTTREESEGVWTLRRSRVLKIPAEDFPNVFKPQGFDAHHMPFLDLYRVIRQPENRGGNVVVYLLEWYRKIAVFFTPFVMVLVGAPLSQFHLRTPRVAGEVVVTIFGGFVYWISNEIFIILGKGGMIHPTLSALGVIFLFLVLGIALLLRSR